LKSSEIIKIKSHPTLVTTTTRTQKKNLNDKIEVLGFRVYADVNCYFGQEEEEEDG